MMGWGSKAIEIRSVESGQLDGVFMHKRTQKLKFLCERNDKVHYGSLGYGMVLHVVCVCMCLNPIVFIFRCSLLQFDLPVAVKSTSWPSTEEWFLTETDPPCVIYLLIKT